MRPGNTNLSSYNPSRTSIMGTEKSVVWCGGGDGIRSSRLGCLMDDGAGWQICFLLVSRLNFGAKIRNKLD